VHLKRLFSLMLCGTVLGVTRSAHAQAWRNCIQGSIAPGGCESIAPGGGQSIAPGGGLSIAPGGGLSIAPGGGQSIAPGGGLFNGPGGGLGPDRAWSRGLDPRTLQDPHPFGSFMPMQPMQPMGSDDGSDDDNDNDN
jgi:hypothetical protein